MANVTTFWWVGSTLMPSPSVFDYDFEDIDNESYRSVVTGDLIRDRISPRWCKLSIEYHHITADQVNTIARAINTNQTYDTMVRSPLFGTDEVISFTAYTSKMSVKSVKAGDGSIVYNMSFSVIQSEGGTHQW